MLSMNTLTQLSKPAATCLAAIAPGALSTWHTLVQQCSYAKAAKETAKNLKAKKFSPKKDGDGKKKGPPQGPDEKNPRLQQIVSMLTPPEFKPILMTDEEKQLCGSYLSKKIKEQNAMNRDLYIKTQLKMAALQALPQELRIKAEQPDYTPFPMNRKFLLHTPPTSYKD